MNTYGCLRLHEIRCCSRQAERIKQMLRPLATERQITIVLTVSHVSACNVSFLCKEDFEDIYYVDNIMLADSGENYLFVRPYVGYGIMAPLTEADRISETIKDAKEEIIKELKQIEDNVLLIYTQVI